MCSIGARRSGCNRVDKQLGDRVHDCAACGLVGDRDAVSATLAACVEFGERGLPASATIDFDTARTLRFDARTHLVLRDTVKGRQDVPSESNAHSARDGSLVAKKGRTPDNVVVARRNVGTAPYPILDEPDRSSQTTPERARTRTHLFTNGHARADPFRDS